MALYKKFRKSVSKARKGVRSVARKTVSVRRKYNVVKRGKLSTMGITKALANLSRKVSAGLEYNTIDTIHTTGSPDVALRQYWNINASAVAATVSTTTTPGTSGYFLRQLTAPTNGTATNSFAGQKWSVESIQWKGTVAMRSSSAALYPTSYAKMYIIQFNDAVDESFQIQDFLDVDTHGEYSTASRRNRNHYSDYKVVGFRNIKLSGFGSETRQDFNFVVSPKTQVRHKDGLPDQHNKRFYTLIVTSPDIADKTSSIDYAGFARMRYIH